MSMANPACSSRLRTVPTFFQFRDFFRRSRVRPSLQIRSRPRLVMPTQIIKTRATIRTRGWNDRVCKNLPATGGRQAAKAQRQFSRRQISNRSQSTASWDREVVPGQAHTACEPILTAVQLKIPMSDARTDAALEILFFIELSPRLPSGLTFRGKVCVARG